MIELRIEGTVESRVLKEPYANNNQKYTEINRTLRFATREEAEWSANFISALHYAASDGGLTFTFTEVT